MVPAISIPALLRLPRNDLALDLLEDRGRDEAEHADSDDPNEHHIDLQQLPRIPDQIADAGLGRDEFGRDQHDEGHGERDAEPRKDHRQRAEEHDPAEYNPL